MGVQTIKVGGQRFVLLPEKEYLALRHGEGVSTRARRPKTTPRSSRASKHDKTDAGDLSESRRRLAEGDAKPYVELRKELRLK
jgi:hypothetical protein